jgi:hypothetical protein
MWLEEDNLDNLDNLDDLDDLDMNYTNNYKTNAKTNAFVDSIINNEKPGYYTVSVVFWNTIHNNYGRKSYSYAVKKEAYDFININDELSMLTQFGEGKILVVGKTQFLSSDATREIEYRMIKGKHKDKFNAFKNKKEGNMMKSTMKDMMKRFMCEVENTGISIADGKIGIKKEGSVFTLSTENTVQENIFDFMSFDMPAIGISTPVANVKVGDIVVENGRAIGWVTKEPSENKVEITRITGTKYSMTPPENLTFGTKNIMIVKSMFEGLVADGANPMIQNMLMMQMMSSDNSDSGTGFGMKEMMLMQMMQGMQGANGTNGTSGVNPMMQNMLMMQMMNK